MTVGRAGVALVLIGIAGALPACDEDVPRPTGPSSVGPIELVPGQTVDGPSRPLGKADGPRFSGVALTSLRAGQCSGAFVVPEGLDLTRDGSAYLLTAGHCLQGITPFPNDVLLDLPALPHEMVSFRVFSDSLWAATNTTAKRVVYSTMKGVDLAIVELTPTRFELRAMGVVPFVLSEEPAAGGEQIAFAGHPGGQPAVFAACRHEWRVPFLLETPFHWFDDHPLELPDAL